MAKYWSGITLLALLFTLTSPRSLATEDVTNEKTLLAGLFPTSCHFSGHFLQHKNVEGLPLPLKSTGDFFYSCDLGLVWSTTAPFRDAILYVNRAKNYRVDEQGVLTPLTGIARYIMSNVFVRLLNGDADYFAEEFAISLADDNVVALKPESDFMKKGIESIRFKKVNDTEHGTSLFIDVTDATGQITRVSIDQIRDYDIDGKRHAFDQCETLYADTTDWCQVLRSPSRAETF